MKKLIDKPRSIVAIDDATLVRVTGAEPAPPPPPPPPPPTRDPASGLPTGKRM